MIVFGFNEVKKFSTSVITSRDTSLVTSRSTSRATTTTFNTSFTTSRTTSRATTTTFNTSFTTSRTTSRVTSRATTTTFNTTFTSSVQQTTTINDMTMYFNDFIPYSSSHLLGKYFAWTTSYRGRYGTDIRIKFATDVSNVYQYEQNYGDREEAFAVTSISLSGVGPWGGRGRGVTNTWLKGAFQGQSRGGRRSASVSYYEVRNNHSSSTLITLTLSKMMTTEVTRSTSRSTTTTFTTSFTTSFTATRSTSRSTTTSFTTSYPATRSTTRSTTTTFNTSFTTTFSTDFTTQRITSFYKNRSFD